MRKKTNKKKTVVYKTKKWSYCQCVYLSNLRLTVLLVVLICGSIFVMNLSNLSTSMLPSPSLDADEPRDKAPARNSPGNTSSLRCTVKEFLPFLPKPMRRLRPLFWFLFFSFVLNFSLSQVVCCCCFCC